MSFRLSVLCVSKGQDFAWPFLKQMHELCRRVEAEFVVLADGVSAYRRIDKARETDMPLMTLFGVESKGYLESVLDTGVQACTGEYVLRLDDDESCSIAMTDWLEREEYRAADNWKFATANLWRDAQSVPITPPLWPDHHTRLAVKAKAGGRTVPHAPSPHGWGELAPVIHLHHKFLVKNFTQRQQLAVHYTRMGALIPWATIPETCFDSLTLAPLGDGRLREWSVSELEVVSLGNLVG